MNICKAFARVLRQTAILPWAIRRRVLCWCYGWNIHPMAIIKRSIILAREVEMEPYDRIHTFVLCKPIDRLVAGEDFGIVTATAITEVPSEGYSSDHIASRKCELVRGVHVGITSRHFIDCNADHYGPEFEAMEEGRTRSCFKEGDVEDLTSKIVLLLSDWKREIKMERYCQQLAFEKYSMAQMIENYCVAIEAAKTNKA